MTVNSTIITSGPYIGNDVSDAFSYNFRITDKTQLKVYETDTNGLRVLLTVDTDYTVAGITDDNGGSITRVAGPLPLNYEWYIRSDYKLTQLTAVPSQGPFLPVIHENVFDKLTFLIQQLNDIDTRTFRISDAIDVDGVFVINENAVERSSKLLGFDTIGDLILVAGTINIPVSEFMKFVNLASNAFDATTLLKSGYVVSDKAEANLLPIVNGRKIFITSSDGGEFTMRTGSPVGTYNDNGGAKSGTRFTNGDGSDGIFRDFYGYTIVDWFDTIELAATSSFNINVPLWVKSGESGSLLCNPTTGDDIQAMARWFTTCKIDDGSTFYIKLADGVHTVNTYIDVDGEDKFFDMRGGASPTAIQITSYAFATVVDPVYQCTVTLASALPIEAVVGGAIGIQDARGTLDIPSANGAQIIKSIAGDRLSFTFDLFSPVGAISNGVIDNTVVNGVIPNQAMTFKAGLIALNTGWDGSSREGFINCINAGRATMRFIGIAYSGAGSTEHDLIFVRGAGSRFYSFDRCGFAGAGDKVLRSYGGAEMFINRSYVGGAAKALEIFQGVAGGFNQFVRTSCGGALTAGITCGHASHVNFAQATMANCGIGFRTTTQNAAISVYPAAIHKCTTAILCTQGTVSGTSATELQRNTTGVDWAAGGTVVGNFTLTGNTSDSIKPGNILFNGGVWYQNTASNGEYEDLTIKSSVPKVSLVDAATTAVIDGDSGNLSLASHSTSRDIFFRAGTVLHWIMDTGVKAFLPATDNAHDIGSAALRMRTIYAGTGAIDTSDERFKQQIKTLNDKEKAVATKLKKSIRTFKFNDSVESKGDKARIHCGVMAQEVVKIFKSEGLNAFDYALLCYDEWEYKKALFDSDGFELRPELQHGNIYGVRYSELLAFIISVM